MTATFQFCFLLLLTGTALAAVAVNKEPMDVAEETTAKCANQGACVCVHQVCVYVKLSPL